MGHELTNEELKQLDMLLGILRVDTEQVPVERPVWRSKPFFRKGEEPLPLEHEAASENFLVAEMEGRCKLSKETRLLEEKRIAARDRKRKPYKKKAKGRFHHSHRRKMKRIRQAKAWETTPLAKLKAVFRQGVVMSQEQWDRLIAPAWQHGVRVKKTRSGTIGVYSVRLLRDGVVVYDGPNQMVTDAMNPEFHSWVEEELKLSRREPLYKI